MVRSLRPEPQHPFRPQNSFTDSSIRIRRLPTTVHSIRYEGHVRKDQCTNSLIDPSAEANANLCPQITTSKEAYQHSYQLTKALSASVNAALSSKAPAPRNTQLLKSGMPQLVPFFFVNEVVFGFAMISFLVYLNTKYILPRFVRMFMARLFMSKL